MKKSPSRAVRAGLLCSVWLLLFVPQAAAGGVEVVRTVLSDNGDNDGYADTQETVTLRLVVRNTSGADLSGLTASLVTTQSAIACLTRPMISIGELAADEERTTAEGFEFVVLPDVQRTNVQEDLSVRFVLSIRTPELGDLNTKKWIDLDLDLNVSGGSTPTVFFESFENGFGAFTTMHLDEGLNPPESDLTNTVAGVLNADGWRCQYSDPEWENSTSYDSSVGGQCFPNPVRAPDAFYFDVVTDRAFTGAASMGFNIFLDLARGYTTPMAQLEAVATTDPINLGWDRVCSESRTTSCDDELDCPLGESCDWARPQLSFKHQISLMDHRTFTSAQPGRAGERAVVSVQLATGEGEGVGPWIKSYPYVNIYDTQANSNFYSCSFDPADDGNSEEDFFDPTDPMRFHGPSSTCAPEFVFAHQGDTDDPFLADNVGDGLSGSGLEGALGIGTWVEPVFDVSRFRGRRIRARFLQTGLNYGSLTDWDGVFSPNPIPGDDGWFIDDVKVTDTLVVAATVAVDDQDNSALPIDVGSDADMDGSPEVCDNCATLANGDQADVDDDGLGDACDPCPNDPLNDADGDTVCSPVDNCPTISNVDQGDVDGDRTGDLCDTCPFTRNFTQGVDEDEDGIDCSIDNCQTFANPDQMDFDGDGVGDACDSCWYDADSDADDDGLCGTEDSCPLYPSTSQGNAVSLSPRLGGRLSMTPDETRIVGPLDTGLSSIAAGGGDPVVLYGTGVDSQAITPDGSTVVFVGRDPTSGFKDRLFSEPIQGGEPLRLDTVDEDSIVFWNFEISPDGSRVVYTERHEAPRFYELHSVPVEGGPSVMLSPPWIPGNVVDLSFRISPDGSRVVVWRRGASPVLVPIDGGPATELPVDTGVGFQVEFTPDSNHVVYRKGGIYVAPADGSGEPIQISAPVGLYDPFELSPDGAWVFYEADHETSGVTELFRVPLLGGVATKLNAPLQASQIVDAFAVSPTGALAAYLVSEYGSPSELWLVPVGGGMAQPIGDGVAFAFSPDGSHLVYESSAGRLFSRPTAGERSFALSDPVLEVGSFKISGDSSVVTYVAGTPAYLYSVPIGGGLVAELSDGIWVATWPPDGFLAQTHDGSATYWQEAEHPGRLFVTWLQSDPDHDGVHRACDCDEDYPGGVEINDGLDNQCPGGVGSGLVDELPGPAGFTDPYVPNRYSWPALGGTTEYEVVRASDPGFTTDCASTSVSNLSLSITELPPTGGTYFYLPRAIAPNVGSAGTDSEGNERNGPCL